jgi:transcriptional regulator with XRE-family HTH domain
MTRIKQLRRAAGLTQRQLADLSGIPLRTLQHYEQGNKDIRKAAGHALQRLAEALHVTIEDIIKRD